MYSFADVFFLAGLVWGAIACMLIFFAIVFARSGSILRHKHTVLILLGGGWSFVLLYLAGYIFDQSYSENVPPHLVPWLTIHGILALLTLAMVTLLIWARTSGPSENLKGIRPEEDTLRLRAYLNSHHRLIGAVTALFWLVTQVGGFINLYILR